MATFKLRRLFVRALLVVAAAGVIAGGAAALPQAMYMVLDDVVIYDDQVMLRQQARAQAGDLYCATLPYSGLHGTFRWLGRQPTFICFATPWELDSWLRSNPPAW
jgi:hypothetical protein